MQVPQKIQAFFQYFQDENTFQNIICSYINVYVPTHTHKKCTHSTSIVVLIQIINNLFYTQAWNHLEMLQNFSRKSGSFKLRDSSWNCLHIQLFPIAVNKIFVLLNVSVRILLILYLIFLRNSEAICPFKTNMMEWLCNIKDLWILKVLWISLIDHKQKLKWCLGSSQHICLVKQHTHHMQLQRVPPPAEYAVWSTSVGNLPSFVKQPAPAVMSNSFLSTQE